MLNYLLHASLLLGVTYFIQQFLLVKETFFKLNRLALTAMIFISVSLPLLEIPPAWSFRDSSKNLTEMITRTDLLSNNFDESKFVDKNFSKKQKDKPLTVPPIKEVNWAQTILFVYFIGVLIFFLNFLIQLFHLSKKSKGLENIQDGHYKIYELKNESPPFSFVNNIYLNPALYDYETYEQILAHEKLHVDYKHYLDKLVGEVLLIFFWFNPFSWGIRNQISNNIEFQVDDALLHQGTDKESYQLSLLKVSTRIHPLSFTNNYNQTLLEKRIEMMNAKKSSTSSSWKYLLILPLFSLTLFSFNPVNIKSVDQPVIKGTLSSKYDHVEEIEFIGSFKNPVGENTFVLTNITGKVEIMGHDKETIEVFAVRTINAPTQEQMNKGIEDIKVGKLVADDFFAVYLDSPYSKFNRGEDLFSYSENCDGAPCFSYKFSIDYKIRIPRNTNLIVENVNGGNIAIKSITANTMKITHITGSVDLENSSGNAELETISGDIRATFRSVPTDESSFKTISGNISISYPRTFEGKIFQKAGDGNFSTDFPVEPKFMKKQGMMQSFHIGDGEGTFRFETTSGNIELKSTEL